MTTGPADNLGYTSQEIGARLGASTNAFDSDKPIGAREIAERAMGIAASICIYTNANVTIEEL